jgi:hypothetical protein
LPAGSNTDQAGIPSSPSTSIYRAKDGCACKYMKRKYVASRNPPLSGRKPGQFLPTPVRIACSKPRQCGKQVRKQIAYKCKGH